MSGNILAEDKEKLLDQTLTRFDGDITVEDVTDSGGTKSHSRYHTFFVQVLLENVCQVIETNDCRREALFSEVCRRLSEAEFLNNSILFDNLLPVRRKLAKQFFNFVKQIHNEVVPDGAESNITAESFLDDVDFDSKLDLHERYENNFDQLEVIAQGGFGLVCKARHKVTGHIYAVKKVIFKYKSDSAYLKVIREAKNIGSLSHPNIVSYNNAWVQFLHPDESENCKSSSESTGSEESASDGSEEEISQRFNNLGNILRKDESQSFEIYFSNRSVEETTWQKNASNTSMRDSRKNHSSNESAFAFISQHSSDGEDSTLSASESYQSKNGTDNYHERNKSTFWDPSFINMKLVLYIQMEYCDCDLRLWLDRRAEGKELPFEMDVMTIFKDILHGVAYIHSKGIIHRDLKPQNIFYSKQSNVMKIGDFGLATLADCTGGDECGGVSSKHSANLGTLPYAAPEQIRYKIYDSKVDIYSLGIILIELLNNFSTEMELVSALKEIPNNSFPNDMVKNWPMHVNLVKNLVQKEPENRMSAKEILSQLNSMEILESDEEIREKNETIEVLRATVKEKDDEIARLKALVKQLQNNQNRKQEPGH